MTLDLQGTKEIKVPSFGVSTFLTRFEGSILSRYFLGNDQTQIKKESEERFYVGRPCLTSEHMFNFIQAYPGSYVLTFRIYRMVQRFFEAGIKYVWVRTFLHSDGKYQTQTSQKF